MWQRSVAAAGAAAAGAVGTVIIVPAVLLTNGAGEVASASAAQQAALSGGACSYTAASDGGATAAGITLSAEQLQIARTGVQAVQNRGLPEQAAVLILAAGYQESRLRNLPDGDRDSVGWLQQRPSQGWGTPVQLQDPGYAAGVFLDRLVMVPGWQNLPPAEAIQAVQVSADGSLYARWINLATALAAGLLGQPSLALHCTDGGGTAGAGTDVSGAGSAAIGRVLARARTALGLPYCFAGGTADGPSHGVGGLGCAGSMIGFDCSGLALFAYAGIGVTLPHYAAAQYRYGGGRHVPLASVEPGDLVFLSADGTPAGIHHVAIIWSVYSGTGGAGQVIEAQDFGVPVHVRDWLGSREAGVLPEALRITPPTTATTPTAPPR